MRLAAALLVVCLCPAAEVPITGPSGEGAATVAEGQDREQCLELASAAARIRFGRNVRLRVQADPELARITGATDARFDLLYADDSLVIGGIGPCAGIPEGATEPLPLGTAGVQGTLAFDPAANRATATLTADLPELAWQFRQRASDTLAGLGSAVPTAQAEEDAQISHHILLQWLRCLAELRGAGDDLALAHGLAADPVDAGLARGLAELHQRTAAALQRMGKPIASIDDLANALAAQLGCAADGRKPLAIVPAFTVRDSPASSALGRRLGQELTAHLPTAADWKTSKGSAAGLARDAVAAAGAEAVILGTIWDGTDGARCVVAAYRLDDGRLIAAAEALLPAAVIAASGLAVVPENIDRALGGLKKPAVQGGLRLAAWTSHGDDAPVYGAGDSIQIAVNADRACHLRITRLAVDGRRTVLEDDQELDAEQARRSWHMPEGIPVAAPFGIEVIEVEAFAGAIAGEPDSVQRLVVTTTAR